uniref:Uncharacterized protein n=1 Tax=Acrochaetium secundatum TaxID=209631 RepID=A0A4D6BN92_9FLOR|nr:hypothetical protein [Acrochaetium secundatum]QBX88439.1 hypothetical protein [Acrochaetium secundatum]
MALNKNVCPVPFDQQPLNEYEALKKSIFFKWSANNIISFLSKLFNIFCILTICSIICSLITLHFNKLSFLMIIGSSTFALCVIDLLLIRLYLGWSYVLKRLSGATIFYEESGWYDGQLWIKPVEILTQDRLISMYNVEPIISRIQKIFVVISLILVIMIVIIVTQ